MADSKSRSGLKLDFLRATATQQTCQKWRFIMSAAGLYSNVLLKKDLREDDLFDHFSDLLGVTKEKSAKNLYRRLTYEERDSFAAAIVGAFHLCLRCAGFPDQAKSFRERLLPYQRPCGHNHIGPDRRTTRPNFIITGSFWIPHVATFDTVLAP